MSTTQRKPQAPSSTDRWLAALARSSCNWPFFVPMSVGRIRPQEPRR